MVNRQQPLQTARTKFWFPGLGGNMKPRRQIGVATTRDEWWNYFKLDAMQTLCCLAPCTIWLFLSWRIKFRVNLISLPKQRGDETENAKLSTLPNFASSSIIFGQQPHQDDFAEMFDTNSRLKQLATSWAVRTFRIYESRYWLDSGLSLLDEAPSG